MIESQGAHGSISETEFERVGRGVWMLQAAEKRERKDAADSAQIAETTRLVRVAVKCGDVTIEQLKSKVRELWEDRPVPRYLREIVEAASTVPLIKSDKSAASFHIREIDPTSAQWLLCAEIAAQHGCSCEGRGWIMIEEPASPERLLAIPCRCPVGLASARLDASRGRSPMDLHYRPILKLYG